MSSTVLQDALSVLDAAAVELQWKSRSFEATRQLLTQEQAIGQYVLYRLLLEQVDPERELYLAVADTTFDGIFSEPIGELVMRELPMKLLIVDVEAVGEAMDTSTRERDIVKQVIQRYAQFKPSHGDIRLDTVFDDTQNRYALMQVGWDRGRRVRGNLICVTLSEGKVWVEYDGMEQGITKDLIAAGIPPERIVLAFLPEEQTAATA